MWLVQIHKLVLNSDFKRIPKNDQSVILKTIFKKLSFEPEKYGAPLRKELKGFWKLRISHYRVIYKIEKDRIKVLVLKVGIRRDEEVYKEMLQRVNRGK